MNISLRFFATLLFALPTFIRATEPSASPTLVSTALPVKGAELLMFNVDFPGGPINQLMVALSKAEGISLNIIGADQTADFARAELPAFSLRNVTLLSFTEVLRSLLEPRGFDLRPVGGPNPNSLVLLLRRIESPKPPRHPPTEFKSFRLSPFLQSQSVEDIVGAIRAGWELDSAHDPKALNLKYHPGTSILLVSGPSEAIRITEDIFRQLKFNPDVPPKPEQKPPPDAEKK